MNAKKKPAAKKAAARSAVTKDTPVTRKTVDAGASLCTFEIQVVCQEKQSHDFLYSEVSHAVEKVCGSGGTLHVRMISEPLFKRPKEDTA